jgi:hypothetical protein
MNAFLQRHAGSVTGVLSGFDRIRFRGTIRLLANASGLSAVLSYLGVLLKDFREYAMGLSEQLKAASLGMALSAGRPVRYLASPLVCKEDVARRIAREDGIDGGLICVLTAVEPCWSFHVRRDPQAKELVLESAWRKCLHLYHYFVHEELGFCHARVQSWLPFNVHVCVNGREWLARRMDRAGVSYERRDNCFTHVSDAGRAQELLDGQLDTDWAAVLEGVRRLAHPASDSMFPRRPMDYYWSADESEWASDVMFKDRHALSRLYPRLVRHGMLCLGAADVMRYLGRRVGPEHGRFLGEVISDVRRQPLVKRPRGEGVRIKHRLNSNSIKMYDKQAGVLRVETTINDPGDFKVYRRAGGDPGSKLCWRKLRKGVADMRRRAQVSQSANERYLEALAGVETSAAVGELAAPLCKAVAGKTRGERARPLNPLADADARLLEAVSLGQFAINGLRNRDVRAILYAGSPAADAAQAKRRSAAVTRKLRLLRAHGLLRKVAHTHRYVVSPRGRAAITALLAARNANAGKLLAAA